MLLHSCFQCVQCFYSVPMLYVSQVVNHGVLFRMFCEIVTRSILISYHICYSEIMDQAMIVAYQKPITPQCYSPRGNHARIMKLVIIRRTMKLMVCQSLIILPPRTTFNRKDQKTHGICYHNNIVSCRIPRSWILFLPIGGNS